MTHDEKIIHGIRATGLVMDCGTQKIHAITYPEAKAILEYVRKHDAQQNKEE